MRAQKSTSMEEEVHEQTDKKKNPSLTVSVYLQTVVGKLEYFLSSSPAQETQ